MLATLYAFSKTILAILKIANFLDWYINPAFSVIQRLIFSCKLQLHL